MTEQGISLFIFSDDKLLSIQALIKPDISAINAVEIALAYTVLIFSITFVPCRMISPINGLSFSE